MPIVWKYAVAVWDGGLLLNLTPWRDTKLDALREWEHHVQTADVDDALCMYVMEPL